MRFDVVLRVLLEAHYFVQDEEGLLDWALAHRVLHWLRAAILQALASSTIDASAKGELSCI